jgi:hypothetical protein
MSLQKTRDAEEGVQGRDIAFPKAGKGALFDIREIFKIYKKSLHVRFMRRKLQIMNPLKRVLPQKSAYPQLTFHRPCKKLIMFIQFSAALSLCLFLPKLRELTEQLNIDYLTRETNLNAFHMTLTCSVVQWCTTLLVHRVHTGTMVKQQL